MSFPFILQYKTEMTKPLQKTNIGGFFGTGNVNAHVFEIELMERGIPLSLSESAVVEGAFVNYTDNSTVLLKGVVQKGKAVLALSKDCYLLHGLFCVTVDVDGVTVFAGESILSTTKTDTIYDPDKTIPSLSEVLAQIEAARQAAVAANEAAEKANAAAGRSPYIGENGHWYVWDAASGEFVDSTNPSIPALTFDVRTGAAGSSVLIEQGGTAEAPVIILTIPRGDTGAVDGVDYYTGNPNPLGTASPGTVNGLSRGDHVHPMPTADQVGAVSKGAQSLTDEEKARIRENIGAGVPYTYTLPEATENTLGGVRIGSGLQMTGGVLSAEGGANVEIDLLWTNASPTSTMEATTITLDLAEYAAVIIEVYSAASAVISNSVVSPIIRKNAAYTFIGYVSGTAYRRTFYVTETGVNVASGITGQSTGDKANNVPYKIYGVKGVKVN